MSDDPKEPKELVPVVVPKPTALVAVDDFMPLMTVQQAIDRKRMINEFIVGVMREDEDFGVIPGTTPEGKKPKKVLLKPGAEKLCSIFGLAPRYIHDSIVEDWDGAQHGGEIFLSYRVRCQLYRGERFMGEMSASANSWESKYRYRTSKRVCPVCGKPTIIKGKEEFGGGWLCWKKKDGCGAVFADNDATIIGQEVGRVPNEDVADSANSILKIAEKRALVSAVLVVTNCSDAFTPDLEDNPPIDTGGHPVGSQAAQDHVKDKKLANAREQKVSPSGNGENRHADSGSRVESAARTVASPNPPEHPTLAALFASIDDRSKPSNVRLAFDMMKAQMIEALPANGEAEYNRLFQKQRLSPQDVETCKRVLTEMWDVVMLAKNAVTTTYDAVTDDVPF